MIDRLRSWLRAWLGIHDYTTSLSAIDLRISKLEDELSRFRTALRAKVQTQVRAVPRYASYEASQIEALNEFKEKN